MSYYTQNRVFDASEKQKMDDDINAIVTYLENLKTTEFMPCKAGAKATVQLEGTNQISINVNIGNCGYCTISCGSSNSFIPIDEIHERIGSSSLYALIEHWFDLKTQIHQQLKEIKSQRETIFNFTV